jgi:tetratricopeptide (TPR) repeat protein
MANSQIAARINQLLDRGEAPAAAELAIGSIAEFSDEPRLILRILEALNKGRDDPQLLLFFTKLEERDVLPFESLVFALRASFRASDYARALQLVGRILERFEGHIEALRTAGRIGNLTRDEGLALQYWERLARAAPNDLEAALQSARIRMRRHQYAQALDWARLAVRAQPTATEPLQIAVGAGIAVGWPEDCDVLLARLLPLDRNRATRTASQLVAMFDAATASRALAVLRRRFPNDETLMEIVGEACSQWLVGGLEQELASREVEAGVFYYALRRVRPTDADAKRALDRLSLPHLVAMREAFGNRDFAGAIEHGSMATRIDPECLEAWQTLGRAQFNRGEASAARDAFRRCSELNPEDARSWLTYGLVLNQTGERTAAFAAFRKAQRLASDAEVGREATASLAALYPVLVRESHQAVADGRIEAAWDFHDAALTIRAEGGIDELRRDLLRATREKIRELWNRKSVSVVPLCRRYLEESPNDSHVLTVLGRTLMGMHAYSEALPVWERLCAQNPSDGHLHLQVARCCRSLRLVDKGVASAEEALRRDAGLQEAAEVAEFLKSIGRQGEAEP